MKQDEIIGALKWRYAAKIFDPAKKVSDEDLHTILESGRLAPSSVGVEPWKFLVVVNQELRKAMQSAAYGQPKVIDAPYLLVIARRTDAEALAPEILDRTAKTQGKTPEDLSGLKQMAEGAVQKPDKKAVDAWVAAQTYIPLGIMIETAALLGIDTCPMEGFDPEKINAILGLDAKHLAATTMLAIGYRGNDPYALAPKTRRSFDEAVEMIV